MMKNNLTRRRFLTVTSAGAAVAGLSGRLRAAVSRVTDQLALLGGKPVRGEPFPTWPVIGESDEKAWLEVLRSKRWNRLGGSYVERFEKTWAAAVGAGHCLAASSGTSALAIALNALEVGPGDEVLVPSYTFGASVNVILLQHALPVFLDTDRETFQVDAGKIEAAITKRTRAIMPVYVGGSAANLDVILPLAKKHGLRVLEDACQSHFGEWRGRKLGTLGDLGCFSFQGSKNLNSGEGGAIVTNDAALVEICQSFHNQGRPLKGPGFTFERSGDNRRLTEFQGALLLAQLARLEEQTRTREQNAAYLTQQLRGVPGITPARMYEGCTRNAYHLYMFRYDPAHFSNLPRERFLKALQAEGIPCYPGYTPLNKEPFLKQTFASRAYRYIYSAKDLADLAERNQCPENDKLCQEAVWLTQNMLLGGRKDMDHIAEAVKKIQKQSAVLARS
ncbi:MAG: DegT/DnrJ/EryC1/StrS family aminotransferase [Blastocatellia bacterium]